MDFICFKIPYEYRPCLDLKLKKITPRTRPQIRLYGVKNTACICIEKQSKKLYFLGFFKVVTEYCSQRCEQGKWAFNFFSRP